MVSVDSGGYGANLEADDKCGQFLNVVNVVNLTK
jgi:hypothetical protein